MKTLRYFIDLVEGKIDEANWWPSKKEEQPVKTSPGIVTTKAIASKNSFSMNRKQESSVAVEEMQKAADSIKRYQNVSLNIDAIEHYASILKKMAKDDNMTMFIPMLDNILNDPENTSLVDKFVASFKNHVHSA